MILTAAASSEVTAADKTAVNAPASSQTSAPRDELTPRLSRSADDLKARLPEDSEARAMLDQILAGQSTRAGRRLVQDGRLATPDSIGSMSRKAYDADGDEQIARREFAGSDDDFARLDRDADHALTARTSTGAGIRSNERRA